MALSATCGPRVLEDLISILGLKEVVPGEGETYAPRGDLLHMMCETKLLHTDAPPFGTVLFSSPLYRNNLHYRIVSKPDSTKDQHEAMTRYILDNHANETGIIYCLSKKVKTINFTVYPTHIVSGYGIRG
jgi:ATP-dependent DNA helicase Q1